MEQDKNMEKIGSKIKYGKSVEQDKNMENIHMEQDKNSSQV